MEQQSLRTGWGKLAIGFVVVFLVRLAPFRPPNVEPILATLMPFAKGYGAFVGFLFGALSITLFDLAVGKVGLWTLVTGLAYGSLGVFSYYALRKRRGTLSYVSVGVVGTILYDVVTGLSVGPLFFGQPFMAALIGQIPFTLWHVGGTVAFSLTLSPLLERWVVRRKEIELPALMARFGLSRT